MQYIAFWALYKTLEAGVRLVNTSTNQSFGHFRAQNSTWFYKGCMTVLKGFYPASTKVLQECFVCQHEPGSTFWLLSRALSMFAVCPGKHG